METTNQNKPVGKDKNTGMAILAYILFFIPLLTDAKNDSFVKYHIKQGLLLFILWVACWIIAIVPFVGRVISPILSIFGVILMVIGIINASQGKEKELPIIGKYGEKLNI